jgi:hypothetical protein
MMAAMEKLVYLVWNGTGPVDPDLGREILGPVADRLIALEPAGLAIDLADDDASGVQLPLPPPPEDPAPIAVVSAWLANHDDRAPFETALAPVAERLAGYLVTESIPTEYGDNRWSSVRDWPDGERSPGVTMVTLMEQPEWLGPDAWYAHWYGTLTPMSTQIQPRTRYVRNAVARAVTPDAPPYRGIVEEAWPSIEHVNDPFLFYCAEDQDTLDTNLQTMLDGVTAFLDLNRIRLATTSEYLLKTR